jgi:adenylate cyclase
LTSQQVVRRLAAILAADVVGYSKLVGRDEAKTLADLAALKTVVILPAISRHSGRLFKAMGDGFLVEFASAVQAVEAARAIQQLNSDGPLPLRIGIHLGDVVVQGDDLMGDGVNVAARIEAVADAGGITLSRQVHDQVRDRLNIAFEDRGEVELKNITRPVHVFSIGTSKREVEIAPGITLPDKPSIAVLPFQNMSDDPEQEYFADGIVEDVITELSRIRWLFVISRNSTFTYKAKAIDVKQVARELGVRYVLEGSVRKGGNRVRITGQLIDAATGAHIWAERYDRDLSDIFAVQDEITASVAGVIEPALAEAEQQRVLRKPPERLDAWEAYQRGVWHFNKYGAEDNQTAQTFFRRAIVLDPNFAAGHYGYALSLQWEIWYFSARPFSDVQELPLAEARLAIQLDDKDGTAHAVLAHMLMWRGEWEQAIAEARIAFVLNPNSSFVISMLGCVLGFGGYHEEALDRLRQAMRASPNDPLTWLWTHWTGTIQYYARKFEASVETLRHVARLRPGFTQAEVIIAASLAHLGRLDEAREHLSRVHSLDPRYQQPPWLRPQDRAFRVEGVRLAAGETK